MDLPIYTYLTVVVAKLERNAVMRLIFQIQKAEVYWYVELNKLILLEKSLRSKLNQKFIALVHLHIYDHSLIRLVYYELVVDNTWSLYQT